MATPPKPDRFDIKFIERWVRTNYHRVGLLTIAPEELAQIVKEGLEHFTNSEEKPGDNCNRDHFYNPVKMINVKEGDVLEKLGEINKVTKCGSNIRLHHKYGYSEYPNDAFVYVRNKFEIPEEEN